MSWKVYQQVDNYGCNVLEYFKSFQDAATTSPLYRNGLRISPPGQFEYDAIHDRLPTVSWIIPTSYQSEHPDYTPAAGADFVASLIDAIAANPDVWATTVLILNYDENDGLFDHVPPPVPAGGTGGEYVDGAPIGGGFRVPCIIVSPWTTGGWIASEIFDHTSTLRFLEQVTGVPVPNLTPWRRATFGDLTSAFGVPARGCPRLPNTKSQLAATVRQVTTLPPPQIPDADQTPPIQSGDRVPAHAAAPSRPQPRDRTQHAARTRRARECRRPATPIPQDQRSTDTTRHGTPQADGPDGTASGDDGDTPPSRRPLRSDSRPLARRPPPSA